MFHFNLDTTSTTTAFWNSGLMQPDIAQHNVIAESKRSDNNGTWHLKQVDINSKGNGNTITRNHTDGSWLSSPSETSHLFQQTTDDSKSVSGWPVLSGHLVGHSSMLNPDHMLDQSDKEIKVVTATSCRLFGIELICHSRDSFAVEKAPVHAVGIPIGSSEGRMSTLSGTDSGYKSDISKASKETKHEQSQVSSKETHCKQIWSRSRTKVLM